MAFIKTKRIARRALGNKLLRVTSLTAVSSAVKLLTNFVLFKVLAVSIGPAGIAAVGQLINANNIFLSLSTGGISQGITKYFAETDSQSERIRILNISYSLVLALSGLIFITLAIFSRSWSILILHSDKYQDVMILMGGALILYSFNNIILAAVNGLQLFRHYVKLNILNSIMGLVITLLLLYFFDLKGVLIATVTYQAVMFAATVVYIYRFRIFPFGFVSFRFEAAWIKKLLGFSLMSVVSMVVVSCTQIFIRSKIVQDLSANQAGIWEALNRLSASYLLFVTTSISAYYLPRLSEEKDYDKVWQEIVRSSKVIIPLVLLMVSMIFLFRTQLINILFDSSFGEMKDLFFLQLTGDFFKIASWMFAFVMWAKRWVKLFIITEIAFNLLYYGLCWFLSNRDLSLNSFVMAYAITYFIYFITLFWVTKKYLNENSIAR